MIVTCPECRKRYKISQKHASSERRLVRCPACNGRIPVGAPAPPKQDAAAPHVTIECNACGRQYRIPKAKLPAGSARARCKACGHTIQLGPAAAPPASKTPPPKAETDQTDPAEKAVQPETRPPARQKAPSEKSSRRRRLPIALAGGGLAVLAVVLIVWFGQRLFPEKAPVEPFAPLPEALNPVAGISVNIPRFIELVEQQAKTTEKARMAFDKLAPVKQLGIHRFDAFLFPDPTHTALAVVALRGGKEAAVKQLLSGDDFLGPYVRQIAKGIYQFKIEAFDPEQIRKVPVDLYELRLIGNDCLVAPRHLFDQLAPGRDMIAHAPAARFAGAIKQPDNVAVLSVRIPKNFGDGWTQALAGHALVKETPQAGMIAGMGVMLLQQMTDPFRQLEFMALGLRIDNGRQRRHLSYAHQFRPEIDGAAVYQAFQNKSTDAPHGVLNSMIKLLEDPRLETGIKFHDNRLTLNIGWDALDDQGVLTALSEATLGQLVARTMMSGGAPTPGPVKTVYSDPPRLTRTVDVARLKQEIPKQIGMALFPDHFWQNGDAPNMTLELDPVAIPNAALAKIDYEILNIKTPDGRDIHRPADQPFVAPIDLSGSYSSRIRLDVKQGTQPADLATARLQFKLALPTALSIFTFKAGGQPQATQRADGIQATAERIEKDIARVGATGAKGIWLIAYDQTGRALDAKESMGSTDSKFVRFSGVIDTLQVVAARTMLHHTFSVEVPLNNGRKIELSRKPQVPPRVRLDASPLKRYAVFTQKEIAGLKVAWEEGPDTWSPGLTIALPKGPFSGKAQWEAHFFGADAPQWADGMPMHSSEAIGYAVDRKKLQQINAAFGKVRLKMAAKIETLHFTAGSGGAARKQLSTGQTIQVRFNRNEIAYKAGKATIIRLHAYDAQNRRLKMDNDANTRKGLRLNYFWGVPTRVEMDVATAHVERLMEFDLRRRPVDAKAYDAFKRDVARQRAVVQTLKQIYQARKKAFKAYGEDLAGFYHLSANPAAPAIEKAAALSDPKGQARFGYKAKAHNGYHFTVLPKSKAALTRLDQTRQKKGLPYTHKGRTIKALPNRNLSDLAAIPADKSQPTFFINWGRVYMKHLNGQPLSHVPDNYYGKNWKEVNLIEQ
ncbi:MAG: zinc-ribbon domain-containing protein [Desulfobacteraceae bacterium]|jgi:predicted Zn finger-like uncharacterized protein